MSLSWNSKSGTYHPADLIDLYRICLLTGDSGKDATSNFKDPDIIGAYYSAPYAVLEPDLCFILVESGRSAGYIIGTRNSENFALRCEKEWFPPLRERYPLPPEDDLSQDAKIIRFIHKGYQLKNEVRSYPAHLHINLLPVAQGQGMGKKLIYRLVDRLKELDVTALHLEVGKKNEGAIKFYERVGFHIIKEYEFSIAYGMNLAK